MVTVITNQLQQKTRFMLIIHNLEVLMIKKYTEKILPHLAELINELKYSSRW